MKYYIAYGSNLNKSQMKRRCPDAVPVGKSRIIDYALVFRRGYLTIEPRERSAVPVVIWRISDADEERLDVYEGVPHFYHKETFMVPYEGGVKTEIPCLVYIMNDGFPIQAASWEYRKTVMEGYMDFGFELAPAVLADLEAFNAEYESTHTTKDTTKTKCKSV